MNSPKQASNSGSTTQKFKFCPHCGSDRFSNPYENRLLCSQCGFTYYVNPPVSVVAVLKNPQNEILLTKRKYDPGKGLFDLPGGFVEEGETLEQALIREIEEELNLKISNPIYYKSFVTTYPFKGIVYYPVDTVFICEVSNWAPLKFQDDVADILFKAPALIEDKYLAFSSHQLLMQSLRKHLPYN